MAVPVLVSKALELILQDLCDRTYDITVQIGAKTVNSLHLKVVSNELNDNDEESKRSSMHETCHASSSGRGRGRGRERGRGRPRKATERELPRQEFESNSSNLEQSFNQIPNLAKPIDNISEFKEKPKDNIISESLSRNIDLHAGVNENSEKPASTVDATSDPGLSVKDDENLGLFEIDRMVVDPVNFAQISSRLNDEDEDYDEG